MCKRGETMMLSPNRLAWLVAVLLGIGLGILGTSTFAPAPADSDPATFSAMRAMRDIERIAARPHPTGSQANAEVRGYLRQRLESLGLTVTEQGSPLNAQATRKLADWRGRPSEGVSIVNLVGILPGRDRALPAVLLMAHHDTVWGSPGAPDDTTGVAAILETIRALTQRSQPARDVIVLFTDGEELGLNGARAFFTGNPLRDHVGAVINLESRGGGGRATLFETSRNNGNIVRRYIAAADRPAGSSLSVFIYKLLPNNTDLTEALSADYAAYNLAFIGRPGLYHSPLATPARLDKGTVQDIGEQTLALTRELTKARSLPQPEADLVFFDAFGLVMPHYPGWAGWLMLAVGALGIAAAAWREPREPQSWRQAIGGAVRMTGLVALTALMLYALNGISGASAAVNYYDRLAALASLEAVALTGALGCFIVLFAGWRGGARSFGFRFAAAVRYRTCATGGCAHCGLCRRGAAAACRRRANGKPRAKSGHRPGHGSNRGRARDGLHDSVRSPARTGRRRHAAAGSYVAIRVRSLFVAAIVDGAGPARSIGYDRHSVRSRYHYRDFGAARSGRTERRSVFNLQVAPPTDRGSYASCVNGWGA